MNKNNIIAAPQVNGFADAYDKWRAVNKGTIMDFFLFMTTPSIERDEFICSGCNDVTYSFYGSVAQITLN